MYKCFTISLSIWLVACASHGRLDAIERVAQHAPDQWVSLDENQIESVQPNAGLSTVLPRELHTLVEEALVHNYDLRAAASRVGIALAGKTVASSSIWPNVRARVRRQTDERFDADRDRSFVTSYNTSLSASWELDIWGQLRNGANASARDLASERFLYEAAQQSLAANVVLTWLDVLEAQQLVELTQKNVSIQQQRLTHQARRMDSGLTDVLDVRLLRNNLASLEDRVLQQDAAYHRSLRELEVLLGRYPKAEAVAIHMLPAIDYFNPSLTPATVLQQRPDILAEEQNLFAAKLRVSEAKKRLWPQLTLTASYGNNSDDSSSLFDFDNWLSDFSAALLQPVFEGGALRARVDQQQARAELAVSRYQQTVLEAWQEIENFLYGERVFLKRVDVLNSALDEAKAVEVLTFKKYEQGLTSSFELLTAQNRSINAEADLIRVRIASFANRVRLHLALGVTLIKTPSSTDS